MWLTPGRASGHKNSALTDDICIKSTDILFFLVTETNEPTHSIGTRTSRNEHQDSEDRRVSNKAIETRSPRRLHQVRKKTSKVTAETDQQTSEHCSLKSNLEKDNYSSDKLSSRRNSSATHPLISTESLSVDTSPKMDASLLIERLSSNRVHTFIRMSESEKLVTENVLDDDADSAEGMRGTHVRIHLNKLY